MPTDTGRTPGPVSSRPRRGAHPLTAAEVAAARHSGKTYPRRGDGPPLPAKEVLWDATCRGLGLRLLPDRKVWILRYLIEGRERLVKLGAYPAVPLPRARHLALIELGRAAEGKDPRPRRVAGERLRAYLPHYLERVAHSVKRSTLEKYRQHAEIVAGSALGSVDVAKIGAQEVRREFRRWTADRGPVAANHCLGLLRRALQEAQREGLRSDEAPDPTARIERNRERRRGREITAEEMGRIGAALERIEAERPALLAAVHVLRLLAVTGARKGEIARLAWEEVDLAGGVLRLRDTKAGPQTRSLPTSAREILAALAAELPDEAARRGPVFPSATYDLTGYTWRLARKMAGCPDLRVHDLRHSLVTRGFAAGLSAVLVGRLVGHRSVASTLRYEHVGPATEPIRQAADLLGGGVAAELARQPEAPVVPLSRSDSGSR